MALNPLKDNYHCPHCNSDRVLNTTNLCEDNHEQVSQLVKCDDCDKEWREVYKIAGWIEPGGDTEEIL